MRSIVSGLFALMLSAAVVFAQAPQQDDGPLGNAAEEVEQGAEEAGEAVQEGAEEAAQETEEAGEEVQESIDGAGDEAATAEVEEDIQTRLSEAALVLEDLSTGAGIPTELLARASCVVVIPNVKEGAAIVGVHYGRGVGACRSGGATGQVTGVQQPAGQPDDTETGLNEPGAGAQAETDDAVGGQADVDRPAGAAQTGAAAAALGEWHPPSMMAFDGGSVGLQVGGTSTDLVMLFMTPESAQLLREGEFTFDAEAEAAAGPAAADAGAELAGSDAEILTYGRTTGLFAGVSLEGSSLRPDQDANEELYGTEVEAGDILEGTSDVTTPGDAGEFMDTLEQVAQ